jgi:hypothetical protein
MKKSYLLWNKNTVKNETIIRDFNTLAQQKIIIPEDYELNEFKNLTTTKKHNNNNNSNNRKRKFYKKR